MRYSRENYEENQARQDRGQSRDRDALHHLGEVSEIEKFADVTYQHVAEVLDYLRGNAAEQTRNRLSKLYEKAHEEALELNKEHEARQADVVRAWSLLVAAVDRLKGFESEVLGK